MQTLPDLFRSRMERDADRAALLDFREGSYREITWSEFGEDIRRLANRLIDQGLVPGDRVVHWSENRYLWLVADLAIQLAGGVHVPAHRASSARQVAWQITVTEAKLALVSSDVQRTELLNAGASALVMTLSASFLASLSATGTYRLADLISRAAEFVTPDSLATILFTSGTTGEPKGVMLSQGNLTSNTLSVVKAFGHTAQDKRLVFLPLSHIFARTCELYTWIAAGSLIALARSRETILEDCQRIQPTLINGVPYFFQYVQERLEALQTSNQPDALRDILGGQIEVCCSGGAALPDHVFDFYAQRNIPLLQGYGMTETSPVISLSTPDDCRRGTVGRPLADVEVRIAADGEIQTKGPHVMLGFWRDPEGTAQSVHDGWLATGDLGRLDDGHLVITGRKKELIVLATGKNISPVHLESRLCQDPMVSQAIVVGDGQKCLAALIVPDPIHLKKFIKQHRLFVWSKRRAVTHGKVLQAYRRIIDDRLRDLGKHEQVASFVVLDQGFTPENGLLTPKLSMRRSQIIARFAKEIADLYAASPATRARTTGIAFKR